MANKNALDLATLIYNTGVVMPGKALATKPPTGTGDLSFSRAGTAVRIDANGAEETMPANVLRVDYRFNLDGANSCPVSLVEAGKSEVLSLSDLIAGGFTFDNCTVCYTVNLQKVVKVYNQDGTSKTFIDGEAFSTGTDTKPDALSFPIGDYSALQDIVIIKAAVDDAKAIELSTNPLLVGRSKLGLAVYVNLLLNGYAVNGVSCLMAAGTTVESFIALGLNTALFAGEQKPTKLSFYQATESGGNLVLPPTLLEADFSRPNIGATSGATVFRDGVLVELAENEPDFSDESGCPVLKMRPRVKNLFLNSATLSTQGVVVTAQAYTISFKGTGTITFTGAYVGALVGTGANDVVDITFTPSAGTVICTVTGVVEEANFIEGVFPTSWVPTLGATLTRSENQYLFTDLVTKGVYGASGYFAIKADFTRGTYTSDETLLELGTNNGLEISDYPDNNLSLVIKHAGTIIKRFNIPAGNNAFIFSWSPTGWALFNSDALSPLASGSENIAVEDNFNIYGRLYPVDIQTTYLAPVALTDVQGAAAWVDLGQSGANALSELGLFDEDYQAVLDYATAQGYSLPSEAQQIIQNQLLINLKAAGTWGSMDSFNVFATDGNSDFALIDWVRLDTMTALNSPLFAINRGFASDGATSFIDSGIQMNIGGNYKLGDASAGAWVEQVPSASGNFGLIGSTTSPEFRFYPYRFLQIMDINGAGGQGVSGATQAAGVMSLEENGTNAISRNNDIVISTIAGAGTAVGTGNYVILRSASVYWESGKFLSAAFKGNASVASSIVSPLTTYINAL